MEEEKRVLFCLPLIMSYTLLLHYCQEIFLTHFYLNISESLSLGEHFEQSTSFL